MVQLGTFYIKSQGIKSLNYIDIINIICYTSPVEIIQNSPVNSPLILAATPLLLSQDGSFLYYANVGTSSSQIQTQPAQSSPAHYRTSYLDFISTLLNPLSAHSTPLCCTAATRSKRNISNTTLLTRLLLNQCNVSY